MPRKGFTLIEVILIILILGVLAISAFPKYLDLSGEAERSFRDGVVSAVSAGIALYKANEMAVGNKVGVFPEALDDVPDKTYCSTQTPCFTNVLADGINDSRWYKEEKNKYSYNDGTALTSYIYNSANGTFRHKK